jgi:hypothetical protein
MSVVHSKCHANDMILIYIGVYTHKYIGHEIANWWGWGGRHVDRITVGGVGRGSWDTGSGSDWGEHLRTTGQGPHTMQDLTYVGDSLGIRHMKFRTNT